MTTDKRHEISNLIYDKLMDNADPLNLNMLFDPEIDLDKQQIRFNYILPDKSEALVIVDIAVYPVTNWELDENGDNIIK